MVIVEKVRAPAQVQERPRVEATNASRANTAPEVAAGPRTLYEEDAGGANGLWGEMRNSK